MIPTKFVRLRLGELLASDPTTLAPTGSTAPAFIEDFFAGVNGTPIQSHAMDSGNGWNVQAGAGEIESNKLQSLTSGTTMKLKTETQNADGAIAVDVATPASGPIIAGLFLRGSDANTGVGVLLVNDAAQLFLTVVEFKGVM